VPTATGAAEQPKKTVADVIGVLKKLAEQASTTQAFLQTEARQFADELKTQAETLEGIEQAKSSQ
jgi:hypothetical protein